MAVGQNQPAGLPDTAQDRVAPSDVPGLDTTRPVITPADLQGKSQDEGCPSSPVLDNPGTPTLSAGFGLRNMNPWIHCVLC